MHTVSVFCCALLLVTCTTESGLAMAGGWGIYTPRLSSVAPGLNSLADPVCRRYTLTRVTHGLLDQDLDSSSYIMQPMVQLTGATWGAECCWQASLLCYPTAVCGAADAHTLHACRSSCLVVVVCAVGSVSIGCRCLPPYV